MKNSLSSATHRKILFNGLLIAIFSWGWPGRSSAQTNYQRLKSFGFPGISTGASPRARLIQGRDGAYYGTAFSGGGNNLGVVFQLRTNGAYTLLHQFAGADGSGPEADLLQASDGFLYGATISGGTNGLGVLFKVNTNGGGFAVLHHFAQTDGVRPTGGLLEGREDGILYGTTSTGGPVNTNGGTIFSVNKDGSGFAVLYNFTDNPGGEPNEGLVEGVDGSLYGTTAAGGSFQYGTVFTIQRSGSSFSVVYSFHGTNGDGGDPVSRLIQGSDGALYGTTKYGGNPGTGVLGRLGNGTIFKINTNGSGYGQLHSFATSGTEGYSPRSALIQGTDGMLYGVAFDGGATNQGTVFKLGANGTNFSVIYNFGSSGGGGAGPKGLWQGNNGALYGTTLNGGANGVGVAFSLSTNGSVWTILHQFVNPDGGDGINPQSTLVQDANGAWYGTTEAGGANGYGAIFKMNSDGSGYSLLYSFGETNGDGFYPQAGTIFGSDSALYGTTYQGGTNGQGTVFRIGTNGSGYSILHHFGGGSDGKSPQAALIQGTDGSLYGTTAQGGANGQGTVFKLSTNGTAYQTLYSFSGSPSDGSNPQASLLQGQDGRLYGTTAEGGSNYEGTVFSLKINGGAYAVLYDFNSGPGDGSQPQAALVQDSNAVLYGTTYYGGANGRGTLFSMNPNGSGYAVLYSFGSGHGDGNNPEGVIIGGNGALYGTTYSGGTSNGTAFTLNTDGTGYSVLYSFTGGADGAHPQAALAQGSDGGFYGTTSGGGDMGFGVVFKLFSPLQGVVITNIQVGASGALLSMAGGIPMQSYNIQAKTNLAVAGGWQVIGSNSAASDGTFQFLDVNASNYPARFYRSSAAP